MKKLFLVFVLAFVIFYPSLFVFFTNDDFFFLKIAQANNIGQFFNFFNLINGPEGFGMYRPLTTQVFYFISWKFFNLSPLPLHIISFLVFFGVIYLIYKLAIELFSNNLTTEQSKKIGLISAFLYAVSATHFGHLYYLATFQELGVTLFVLLSCLSFIKNKKLLSFVFFVLALMSKETAVVTPILLALISFFQNRNSIKSFNFKKLLLNLLPFVVCLLIYLFIRVHWYGFATGDSYIWNFSVRKLANTSFWYLLWSLNLPESLVDFIGPGFKVNPNLFLFWKDQIIPIFILFLIQETLSAWILVKVLLEKKRQEIRDRDWVSTFCIAWFLVCLLPVIFLPIHKFTFYLTLPLIGIVFRIAYILVTSKVKDLFITLFLVIWTLTSVFTLRFTIQTNWITQDEVISKKVFEFFKTNESNYLDKKIVFTDTEDDLVLPWSPTEVVKTALSKNNFFDVFYPNISKNVYYEGKGDIIINSRQFLGY